MSNPDSLHAKFIKSIATPIPWDGVVKPNEVWIKEYKVIIIKSLSSSLKTFSYDYWDIYNICIDPPTLDKPHHSSNSGSVRILVGSWLFYGNLTSSDVPIYVQV